MSILLYLLIVIMIIITFTLRIISWSLGRSIFLKMKDNSDLSQRLKIGFNLKTMSLTSDEISAMPAEIQKDLHRKKTVDTYFFVVFVVTSVLLAIKAFTLI